LKGIEKKGTYSVRDRLVKTGRARGRERGGEKKGERERRKEERR
jgi:hypothetical protein